MTAGGVRNDPDQRRRVIGLFLRFGEHHGDRLPFQRISVSCITGRCCRPRPSVGQADRRGRLHPRRVTMRHHQRDAGRRLGGRSVEVGDRPARDGAVDEAA